MTNNVTIPLLLLLLCGAIWFVISPSPLQPTAPPEEQEPPVQRSAAPSEDELPEFFGMSGFDGPVPELKTPAAPSEKTAARFAAEKLSGMLEDKDGSYTNLSDLFRSDSDVSVEVQSDWATRYLLPDRRLPNLGVRIIKNPETGEYEPAGGSLTLPGGELEAGYEVDPGSGGNKATLQWKKFF